MIKKIKYFEDIKCGDSIMLYGVSGKGTVVNKRCFKVTSNPRDVYGNYFRVDVIREDGTPIWDRWNYNNRCGNLRYDSYGKYFVTSLYYNEKLYIDPKTPCEAVIARLKEDKRNINKKIMDCQYYMNKAE